MTYRSMQLVDTHSHIYDPAFDADRKEVLDRAIKAGVSHIFLPAIDPTCDDAMFSLAAAHPELCYPMMGLHPTSINDNPSYRNDLARVAGLLDRPPLGRFYAVGEVGLDFHWSRDFIPQQTEAFRFQLELSIHHNLPLVIHTRDAWPEMIDILSHYKNRNLRGIMHSFAGTYDHYQAIRAVGNFRFGIGGTITFKNSTLPEVLRQIPLEDIVLETDAPYLTPVPFRGQRNESAYIRYVCDRVAEIYNMPAEIVAETTTQTALDIFGLKPTNVLQ